MSFRQTIIASFAWLSLGFNPSDLEAQSFAPNIKEMALESRAWSGEPKELRDLEQDVTAIIQSDPYNFFAHYILSQVYLRLFTAEPEDMMLLKAASDLAQQAIELAPAEEYGYIALATVLDAMGHSAKATQLLKSIINKASTVSWRLDFILAKLKAETHGLGEVLRHLHKAAQHCHNQVSIVMPHLIAALDTRYSGDELIAQLAMWEKQCPHSLLKLTLAQKHSKAGNHKMALKKYKEIKVGDPHYTIATLNSAIIKYRELNQKKAANIILAKLLKSSLQSDRSTPQIHLHLGIIALREGKHKRAQQSFSKAIELSDDFMPIVNTARNQYAKAKKFKELSNFYKTLIQLRSGNALLYALNAEVLSEKLQQHKESIAWFTDAILLDPSQSEYYNGAGLAFYRIKNLNAALDMFSAASQIDPSDAVSHYNQACMQALLGKSDKALDSLVDAIALDPSLKGNAAVDPDLKSLRKNEIFQRLLGPEASQESIAH